MNSSTSARALRLLLLTAASLPLLTACGIGQMGNCGAFCDNGKMVRAEVGAPQRDSSLGKILSLGHPKTQEYWVWGRSTIERIGELPGQPKVDALRYNSNLSPEQAQGSRWFSLTWGNGQIDPKTKLEQDIPVKDPAPPPGLYRLTSQVSFVDKREFGRYLPFQGKPRTTTISVEAGKTTVLSYRTGVDASTTPITAWVDVVQLGSKEALALMYKNPYYRVSPNIQIAEPPASGTH